MKKFLINRVGFGGDILMATAALDAIKKKHPDCEITFSVWKQFGELLALNPAVSELTSPGNYLVSNFDKWWDVRHDKDPPRFKGDNNPLLYWGAVHAHQAHDIGMLDIERVESFRPQIYIGPDDACRKIGEKPLVVLSPWSANGRGWRLWDFNKWRELVVILKSFDYEVVQIGGKDDPEVEGVDIQLCGKTRLAQVPGILAIADLAVVIDSFVAHCCHAKKFIHNPETKEIKQVGDSTPTVLLAGPVPWQCVVPEDAKCVPVSTYPDCGGPCNHSFATEELPICEYKNSCMESISVSDVMSGVEELSGRN